MLSSYGDVWGQFGFSFILTKMKSLPGCRWEQWLLDLIGTSITTNFSESTLSFLVAYLVGAHHTAFMFHDTS